MMIDLFMLTGVFVGGTCWGSYLNGVAHRLLYDKPLLRARSHCPSCDSTIAWFDLIPIFSWILLQGKCRTCKNSISLLYPTIELLTGSVAVALFYTMATHAQPYQSFFSYALFFSLLIIATRTDLEAMVIPELVVLGGIPFGLFASWYGFIECSLISSLGGIALGVSFFLTTSFLYKLIKKQEGLGFGDVELIALIGSFTGIMGTWATIIMSSLVGTVVSLVYCMATRKMYSVRIPFGPFLAFGALIFVLFRTEILVWLYY